MISYTATLEEDPVTGDLILPFTPEILAKLGWVEGDTLVWTVNADGTVHLNKKNDT
jgi:hypothetical protein